MIKSPYATKLTLTGQRDMKNRKPYRNAAQKAAAKDNSQKCKGGYFVSNTPVSYHR